jgi:hypothetical protein
MHLWFIVFCVCNKTCLIIIIFDNENTQIKSSFHFIYYYFIQILDIQIGNRKISPVKKKLKNLFLNAAIRRLVFSLSP